MCEKSGPSADDDNAVTASTVGDDATNEPERDASARSAFDAVTAPTDTSADNRPVALSLRVTNADARRHASTVGVLNAHSGSCTKLSRDDQSAPNASRNPE
ncbi:hypothetical protein ACQEVZ_28815 [Dactylosporangium sp. CA-152071]|uniref:hypothetical protein n=1 Tax=Dactylosporangium sp. CA-152071 TaxID=3239933 RepID=UPI003D93A4E2